MLRRLVWRQHIATFSSPRLPPLSPGPGRLQRESEPVGFGAQASDDAAVHCSFVRLATALECGCAALPSMGFGYNCSSSWRCCRL